MISPLVSIIIPAYNSERFIGDTLASVQAQTFKDYEVIIVDDGSPDNQRQIILNYVNADQRFKYIYQENQGVSTARNNGFNVSVGSFIAFLDSDDIWLSENLSKKVEKFNSGEYGLVHSDAWIIDENDVIKKELVLQGREGNLINDFLKRSGTQIPGPSSVLIKREVLKQVGLFDTNLSTSADLDFFLRVAARYPIGRVACVTWLYREHPNNMHRNVALMEQDMLYVYKKASDMGLFFSPSFKKNCFSSMYLVLAASWAGDGKNLMKGFYYLWMAVRLRPLIIFNVLKRYLNKYSKRIHLKK